MRHACFTAHKSFASLCASRPFLFGLNAETTEMELNATALQTLNEAPVNIINNNHHDRQQSPATMPVAQIKALEKMEIHEPNNQKTAVSQRLTVRQFWALLLSDKLNLTYTLLIFLNQFFYGVTITLIGTALVDLSFIYDVDIDAMSYLKLAIDIGYLVGSLSGFIIRFINRQLAIAFFFSLMSLTIALLPHYRHYSLMLGCMFVHGVGDGGYDVARPVWYVAMWPVGYGIIIQASQFMIGLGSIVAPLLMTPFVLGERNFTSAGNSDQQAKVPVTQELRRERLATPFAFDGIVGMLAPFALTALYFTRPYIMPPKVIVGKNNETVEEGNGSEKGSRSSTSFCRRRRFWNVALCGLMYGTYLSAEQNYFTFSNAMFQYFTQVEISAVQSELLTFILYITFTFGRLITAAVAIRVQPEVIISYHYVVILLSFLAIYLGSGSYTAIQLSTAALGFGFSAMMPAQYAFAQKYLGLTDVVASTFSFLFAILSLAIPLVLTQCFHRHPLSLLLMEAVSIAVSGLLFLTLLTCFVVEGRRRRSRRKLKN